MISEKQIEMIVRKTTQIRHPEVLAHGLYEALSDVFIEMTKYADDFKKGLMECETAEGRDRMRMVQSFVEMTEINTDANNIAFINGLAILLSGGDMPAMKFRKITKGAKK